MVGLLNMNAVFVLLPQGRITRPATHNSAPQQRQSRHGLRLTAGLATLLTASLKFALKADHASDQFVVSKSAKIVFHG